MPSHTRDPKQKNLQSQDSQKGGLSEKRDKTQSVKKSTDNPQLNDGQNDPQSVKKNTDMDGADLIQLGGDPFDNKKVSPPINKTLATVWQKVMQIGVSKEIRKELINKHPPSENCDMMEAPSFNPELHNIIGKSGVKKDQFQIVSQNQLGAGISALRTAVTKLLTLQQSEDQSNPKCHLTSEILYFLSDAGKLFTDLHHEVSLTRRNFITSGRDTKLKIVADNSLVDRTLFKEKFAEMYKAAKEVERVGKDLSRTTQKPERKKVYQQPRSRQTTPRSSDLNCKGPPRKS